MSKDTCTYMIVSSVSHCPPTFPALHVLIMRNIFFVALSLSLPSYVVAEGGRPCYWPSGYLTSNTTGQVFNYVECYPDNPQGSSCCLEGEACLSNGLCFGALHGIVSHAHPDPFLVIANRSYSSPGISWCLHGSRLDNLGMSKLLRR